MPNRPAAPANRPRSGAARRQRGSILIEALLAATLTMTILAFGSQALMEGMDDMRDHSAAQHFQLVQGALDRFMRADRPAANATNYAFYANQLTSVGQTTAIPFAELQAQGFLPQSFQPVNPYGDRYVIRARLVSQNPDILETAIVTEAPNLNANIAASRADRFAARIPAVAAKIGAQGGFVEDDNGNLQLRGSFGGWQSNVQTWGFNNAAVGSLANIQAYDSGLVITDYLHRAAVPGHPEANTMFTDLNMNGNDINDVGTLRARDVVADTGIVSGAITSVMVDTEILTAQNILLPNDGEVDFAGGVILDREVVTTVRRLHEVARTCNNDQYIVKVGGSGGTPDFQCRSNQVQRNSVVAFNRTTCPPGWIPYTEAEGRFIMGAGTGPGGETYAVGQRGGSHQVYLGRGNLPGGVWYEGPARYDFRRGSGISVGIKRGTQAPIETTPPYVALMYCEKS